MLKKPLNKYLKSEFSRNVLTLFSGTTIAQIIPFIVSPILTRIYSPEDFGLLALFIATFSIVSIIVTLQYESAIVLPKDDKDAINLLALCLLITLFISSITLLIVISFNKVIAQWLNNEHISFWLYFIPIPIFLTGLFNTLNYWSIRKKQFKRLAIRNIAQSTTTAGTKLLAGIVGLTKNGLIIGTIIGQATATGMLALLTWKDDKHFFRNIKKSTLIKNAKTYQNFPKFTAWQGFFDVFNTSGTSFIISALFGSTTLGLFSFTIGILQKPLQLLGNAVTHVFYQKASETYNNSGDIWIFTKKTLIHLTLLALIIFAPIVIMGPNLFSIVFGKVWYEAGNYARLLFPWLAVRFIVSPITSIPQIINKQKDFFLLSIIINILFPIGIFLLFKINVGIELSLFIISLIAALYYIYILKWIRAQLKKIK